MKFLISEDEIVEMLVDDYDVDARDAVAGAKALGLLNDPMIPTEKAAELVYNGVVGNNGYSLSDKLMPRKSL
jgi:hypothetical protein